MKTAHPANVSQKKQQITSNQLYYIYETLGIHSIIQPDRIRRIYRLYNQTIHPAFLFFCEKSNSDGIQLIKNISQALSTQNSMIIEIISHKPEDIKQLNNIYLRFPPIKGIIIFGENLSKWIPINSSITCCILCPIKDLLPSVNKNNKEETELLIKRKKEVWKQLKKHFNK